MISTLYSSPSLIPFIGRSVAPEPQKPGNVRIDNGQLKWDSTGDVRSVIYYFADPEKEGVIHAMTRDHFTSVTSKGFYCISTINKDNKESDPSEIVEKR